MKDVVNDLPGGSIQLQDANSSRQQNSQSRLENSKLTCDALVLDAILRQSLVTVRSLGSRGLQVAAVEATNKLEGSDKAPTFSSRWCQQKFIAPSYERSTEPYLAYLEQVLDQTLSLIHI